MADVKLLPEPIIIKGTVSKGFGRGSKLLGIPTANLPADQFEDVLADLPTGIYAAFCSLHGPDAPSIPEQPILKAAVSIGWNPYFKNEHKTIEPHILYNFEKDFYGSELRLVLVGYIRPEANFVSLEALVEEIKRDIEKTDKCLETEEFSKFKALPVFTAPEEPPASSKLD